MKVEIKSKQETGTINIGNLELESGKTLSDVELAYERAGAIHAPVILVCHALTGSQVAVGTEDDPGYWSSFIQQDGYIDLNQFQTYSFNVLGGCNGSTGPEDINPETGVPYQADFPFITVRDMVHAQKKALDILGVGSLKAVIGGSLGGMQVLEWGILYPDYMEKLFPLAVTPYLNDYAISFNHIARLSIMNDPNWNDGFYPEDAKPEKGLSLARMVGMVTYRSGELFNERFSRQEKNPAGRSHQETAYEIESYLNYQGKKLTSRFDPNSYLYLLKAMDTHDIGRDRGGWENAISGIKAPLFAVGFRNDLLFPPGSLQSLVETIREEDGDAAFYEVDTTFSHDGFLVEFEKWGDLIKSRLESK